MRARDCRSRLSFLFLVGVLGCDITAPAPVVEIRVDSRWVTGDAADSVDPATGLFVLAQPAASNLTLSESRELAAAFAVLIGDDGAFEALRQLAEQDRGAPIGWSTLEVCGRSFRIDTPFGALNDSVPRSFHRNHAAKWSITMCSAGEAQLALGVSDAPPSVAVIDGALTIADPDSLAGVFSIAGIPERYPRGLPLSPEEAVQWVHAKTGVRTLHVPIPINQHDRGAGQLPFCSSWKVLLERPVPVRRLSDGRIHQSQELLIRRQPACFSSSVEAYIRESNQPSVKWLTYPSTSTQLPESSLVALVLPTRFSRVEFLR